MKKFLVFLLIVGAGASIYFTYPWQKNCEVSMKYSIGTFDERFGLSKEDFIDDLNTASNIWGNAVDKKLFEYDTNPSLASKLTINFIYDDRQKTTQTNAVLKDNIDRVGYLASDTKQQYTSLKNQYDTASQEYDAMLSQFKQDESDYTSQVEYWNEKKGAPKDEYNKLMEMKALLENKRALLESKRIEVNSLADQVNAFIKKYNLLVKDINTNVSVINSTADKEFDEGIYDPNKNEIEIYQYDDKVKLVRVLTHELGHALGLGHNNNPSSIMYPLNKDNDTSLSPEDLADLKAVCEQRKAILRL